MPEVHTSGGPPKIIKSAVKGRASSRGVTLVWRNGTIGPRSLLPMVVVALGACVATSLFGELSAADRWVQTVAFSRDGRILVADVDHYLFVWEADSGELLCGADYSPRYTVITVGSQRSLAPAGARAGVDT